MRAALKGIFEAGLLHGGPATVSRIRHRGRSLVLAYHNVIPDELEGTGDAPLHLPVSRFRSQLDALVSRAEVVPLDRMLQPPSLHEANGGSGDDGRPRVAITFDDAYRGAVIVGLPELARRGMSATVFVSPGRLGDEGFWWDVYAREATVTSATGFRDTALNDLGGDDERVSRWAASRGWTGSSLPDVLRPSTEEELAEAAELPGITLASHTWSHPNLTALDDAALRDELARPLDWLAARGADTIDWVAYPYGIADARVASAAADAGYTAGLRVNGGWLPAGGADPLLLPRLNVPAGLSDAGFRLRLAGLLCGE